MKRTVVRIGIALALVLGGWTLGRGQNASPDFVLLVDSPVGTTNVQCVRGCELVFGRSVDNPSARHMPNFTYTCSGGVRCSSQEIAGWIRR
jgi:hypothetical protein